MIDNNMYVYSNWTGQKIKTSGLTMHQNSTNNILHFITVGHYVSVTATFKTPDGKLSDAYHMIDEGKYTLTEEDSEYEVLSDNADNLYHYTLQVPYKVSIMTILGNSGRLNVAFSGFNYDTETNFLKQAVTANSQIIVSAASQSTSLDESYSSSDVENLWKVIGQLTERLNDLEDRINE